MRQLLSSRHMGARQSRAELDAVDYLRTAQTGDILLWESNGVEAWAVKLMSGSPFSHVGLILRLETPLRTGDSGVYLFHSPSGSIDGVPDLTTGKPVYKDGPQLNAMEDILYRGRGLKRIVIRKIVFDEGSTHAWARGTISNTGRTASAAAAVNPRRYERNMTELFQAAYDGPGGDNTENTREFFCSELVAWTMKHVGLRAPRSGRHLRPSNEFAPHDFTETPRERLDLIEGIRFRNGKQISYTDSSVAELRDARRLTRRTTPNPPFPH